jgi:hypothetical protein
MRYLFYFSKFKSASEFWTVWVSFDIVKIKIKLKDFLGSTFWQCSLFSCSIYMTKVIFSADVIAASNIVEYLLTLTKVYNSFF